MLQVSRPTIRTALHLVAKDGLIEIHQGRRNRLLRPPARAAGQQNRIIGLVTSEPIAHISLIAYQGISEMRAHLTEQGFATEILVCPTTSERVRRRKIEEFIHQHRILCCVLLSVSRDLQEWFAARSLPALVLGSCHPDVKLPSLDIDQSAVCRHAAGVFLSRGHRHLALVIPESGRAGDLASEQGFTEAVNRRGDGNDARGVIIRHNGTAHNITAKLDTFFGSDHPPTALLVAKPQHVFTIVIYLLKHGLAVPDKVSLIARDHDHLFETVSPPIAHYLLKAEAFAQRLLRLMLQMVGQGYLAPEPNLVFPKYCAGGTVKRLT